MTTGFHWHRAFWSASFAACLGASVFGAEPSKAGLVAKLAIDMGKKCGVNLWTNHDNNGKNTMAAMLFAAQDNRTVETRFFAKMVTASYQNRESGHTGQGFSYLWGALGANAGGPEATAAFFKEASWHLDLVRRSDGSFTYDGGEQYGPGRTDGNTYFGKSSYYGLSPAATYVLTYSLPLKKLHLTGKDANPKNGLTKKDVAEAIAASAGK